MVNETVDDPCFEDLSCNDFSFVFPTDLTPGYYKILVRYNTEHYVESTQLILMKIVPIVYVDVMTIGVMNLYANHVNRVYYVAIMINQSVWKECVATIRILNGKYRVFIYIYILCVFIHTQVMYDCVGDVLLLFVFVSLSANTSHRLVYIYFFSLFHFVYLFI
eukprot:231510_1